MKPLRWVPAWAVVDTTGRVLWSMVFTDQREASQFARHPLRRIVRLSVAGVVRKSPRKVRR